MNLRLFAFVVDRGIEPLCQDWESCILTIRWIHLVSCILCACVTESCRLAAVSCKSFLSLCGCILCLDGLLPSLCRCAPVLCTSVPLCPFLWPVPVTVLCVREGCGSWGMILACLWLCTKSVSFLFLKLYVDYMLYLCSLCHVQTMCYMPCANYMIYIGHVFYIILYVSHMFYVVY